MIPILRRLHTVETRIAAACVLAERRTSEVLLLAVSKGQPLSALQALYAAGQRCFAESYVQEALPKITAMAELAAVEWHFVGPLQANKTRHVAENFAWVHSVDRLKIAERLSAQRPGHLPALNVCVEVNVSGAASKGGCTIADCTELCAAVAVLPRLRLRGLMALPEPSSGTGAIKVQNQRRPFAQLRQMQEILLSKGLAVDTLSMGMSDDCEAAILEGATIVRIGRAIFI